VQKRNLVCLLIFVFFLFFYGLTARAHVQVSDEVAVFATSVSLVTEGDLAIDELQWLQDVVNIGQKGRDGHLYAKYFPGNVFSAAAVYKLTQRQNDQPYIWNSKVLAPSVSGARLTLRLNAVFGALAMAGLFLLLSRYYCWQTAVLTVVFIGICSDWWYQSRGFFSEVGSGAFLIFGLYFASTDNPYLCSLALALSILFRPLNLIALPIWIFSIWRVGQKPVWSMFPILGSLIVLAIYNFARFDSLLNFGYATEGFSSSLFAGLYGILFSPGRSLFIYSPILLLAFLGAALLYHKERHLLIVCSVCILAYVVAIATWHSWDGGWSWGSRLLTPVLPLIGVLIAPVVEWSRSNKLVLVIVICLAVAGAGVQMIALARDPLQVMIRNVANGDIKYDETLYTFRNSWIAIQYRSLNDWQPCDLDAYSLRSLFELCQQ